MLHARYTTKASLLNAIENITYPGGTTDTTDAVLLMRTQVFNASGDRPDAPNVAFIVTDGVPTVASTVPAQISAALAASIAIYAVGVTDGVDEATLRSLTSPPQQVPTTMTCDV